MHLELPPRAGPRPATLPRAPHSQLNQLVPPAARRTLSSALLTSLADLAHVSLGQSMRAPPGTVGLYLDPEHACENAQAFLIGHEFAHIHFDDDGSLHAILPEPLRSEAIDKGWAEPHPLAGQPTVSPDTVMLYAPRDNDEVVLIAKLVRQSFLNAMKNAEERSPT
ncbi:phospholipase [Sphingobium sp. SCG-1]|uniref:luciferase domain-containing protein n=1 Tax=Sphingobium sp. SCG-1 TaxID=2072936 RepID=UPI000CD67B6A|nr:luciferase family protein [Sphingobium sp. SCG-1]AUW58900.1 phospholipase [Sphingobium sp. SCG-1]